MQDFIAGQSPAPALAGLFTDRGLAFVQRALAEFVAQRPVLIEGDRRVLVLPVESLSAERLAELERASSLPLQLFVSASRAAALGHSVMASGIIDLPPGLTCDHILEIACRPNIVQDQRVEEGDRSATAAIELVKLSRMLPAVIALGPSSELTACLRNVTAVAAEDVLAFRARHVRSLRLISSADVPLASGVDSQFRIFRDDLGQFWTAVLIGEPDLERPVPVRLHSSCLTGDVFGSRRCDCGDQLAMSVVALAARGGGVLLYLDQEGCGIGLANKMRAYALQDGGLDTIDANTTLGFERDERRYDIAARMLELLGIGRIALLTNNPLKMSGLRDAGIDIVERIPLIAPVNASNARYLAAKQLKAGHMIGTWGTAD